MACETVPAQLGEELRNYACWEHSPQKLTIYMHLAVLQAISTASVRCFKAKPLSETGGLLWGKQINDTENGSTDLIIVSEAQFISAEGSLYNTTPLDGRNLLQAARIPSSENKNLTLLGYFRSHVRDDFCLSQQDTELVQECMSDPRQICLLVRPFEVGVCMAGFFFWQDGRLQTDASDLEVPFIALAKPTDEQMAPTSASDIRPPKPQTVPDTQSRPENSQASSSFGNELYTGQAGGKPVISIPPQFSSASDPTEAGSASAQQHPRSVLKQPYQQDTPQRPLSKGRSWSWIALTLIFGLFALIGAAAFRALPNSRSRFEPVSEYKRSNNQIGLQVARTANGQLNLSWNWQISSWANVQDAELTIYDHQAHKALRLDKVQLRSGKLTYFSNGVDLQFRLEVYFDNGHSLAESVRLATPGV